MFCPECRSEYRQGFKECSECHVPLVETLPPIAEPTPDVEVVTVYRSTDPALTMLARSLLDSAGIPYTLNRENLQDLMAGRYLVSGPTEFQVEAKDAAEANAVLADLDARADTSPEDEAIPAMAQCIVRTEEPGDEEGVRDVGKNAFRRDTEATLVDRLRSNGNAVISLVAVCDGEIVGHVAFSPMAVQFSFSGFQAVGLGPIAVREEYQHNGIGSMLVERGIDACRNAGHDVIFVLGNPDFWQRFGFQPTRPLGLFSEYNAENSFLALELKPETLKKIRGLVKYTPEFAECGC